MSYVGRLSGPQTYYGATPPDPATGLSAGSLWVDTTTMLMYMWGGSVWFLLSPGTSTDIQSFTAGGTWTKPTATSLKRACITMIAGGGGGGGGMLGAAGTTRTGGGGGAPGQLIVMDVPLSSLPATAAVAIGAAGTGGAGGAVPGPGVIGGGTTFGTIFRARGGNFGAAGGGVAAPGGVAPTHVILGSKSVGSAGSDSPISGTGLAVDSVDTLDMCAGAGSGGCISSANAVGTARGGGAIALTTTGVFYSGAAGGANGIPGANGLAAPIGLGGSGPGGGVSSIVNTVSAGNGGNGAGYGGPGAGGGACVNGGSAVAGNGGAGTAGYCTVTCY